MATRELKVKITGDADNLHKSLSQASDSSSKFGSSVLKMGKYAAFAAGAAGIGGLVLSLKTGFDELAEGQQVAAQTNAVLKSTGGAANVTAKQVDSLAQSISNYSGIDDEAVQAGENMLLTFRNVRNEAGAGNDIFNQATVALNDMATAMNSGAQPSSEQLASSAIRLGKALNDPVKGMTALSRVGVQFTKDQQEQIKAMVKAGDTMGAQKVILGELTKEFGGSAKAAGETLPGQLARLRNSFDNAAAGLAQALLPGLTKLLDFVNSHMPQIQAVFEAVGSGIAAAFRFVGPLIVQVVGYISNLFSTLSSASGTGQSFIETLTQIGAAVAERVLPILQQLGDIGAEAISRIADVIRQNGPQLQQIFENLGTVIQNLAKVVIPILDVAFTKVLPLAIKVLIPVLVVVTTALAKISEVVVVVAGALTRFAGTVASVAGSIRTQIDRLSPVWQGFATVAQKAVALVTGYIKGVVNIISGVVNVIVGIFTGDWARAWNGAKTAVSTAVAGVKAIFIKLPGEIAAIALRVGTALIQGIIDGMSSLLPTLLSKASSVVSSVKDKLEFWHSPPEAYGADIAARLIDGMAKGFENKKGKAAEAAAKVVDAVKSEFETARGDLSSTFGSLADSALQAFDAAMNAWVPPAQKLLNKMQLKDAIQSDKKAVADAQRDLAQAQAAVATEATPENIQAVKDANQALYDALRQQRENELSRQAQEQQAAHEKKVARQRVHLQDELDTLQRYLDKHPEKYRQVGEKIHTILSKLGVDSKFWGSAIGIGIADGLRDSEDDVRKAASHLAEVIRKILKLNSPAEEGPMADLDKWWKPFAGTLLKGFDATPIAQRMTSMAGDIRSSLTSGSFQLGSVNTSGPALSGAAAMSGDVGVPLDLTVPIYLDSSQIAEVVRREYLRFEKRNGRSAV